ncbi:MAG: TolC family protein, partial [Candidatus Hydrogenedentota bacterium]
FNYFIEEWSGGLTLSLTQPLLRGRGKAVNLARVRIAKNSRASAEQQLKLQTMTSLAEVIKAYWDLVGAVEELKVRQSSMANAERLLKLNEKRLEIGTGAAIDVVQARAGLAARQSDVISAMGTVADATNRLRNLLNVQKGEPLQERRIRPVDQPTPEESEVDIEESLDRALELRPEVRSAELVIENAGINKTVAKNDLLPQLDIGGSVFQGGRGPDEDDVFNGVRERNDNSYTVNIQGSVPIGNRAARGQYERTRIEESEAERQLEKTKQDIMLAVRTAYTAIETNRTLVESSKQSRKLQEVNVAAEEKRLELGLTSSYQVLDMQDDLTAAQSQEVQAIIALEKAFVDLRLAEGSLLQMLGIEFVPPEPEPTVGFVRSVVPFVNKE